MANINVNRDVTDQFYRYKMPRLLAKVEGKGNGIKTVIVNMMEVAKALSRPPTYTTKYFGCELGAQTQMDFKTERFIVNGSHEAGKLQDLLDGFIKKFVLCPDCSNPETDLHVHQKKGNITQRCVACGYNGPIDMRHKLTTFILKNPPSSADMTGVAGVKKEKSKKSKKGKDEDGGNEQQQAGDGVDGEFANGDDYDDWGDDDGWGEDTTQEDVARRLEELTDGAKGMTINEDLEKTQSERLDMYYEYVKKLKEGGEIDKMAKEIVAEAERLDVRDKATLIVCELLLTKNMHKEVAQYKAILLRFCREQPKAQKYLLGWFEQMIKINMDLLPRVPVLLKIFYDADILDEEVIVDWASKVSKKYVSKELAQDIRNKAQPFVKWLQEASEEESSEDDEDIEVVYSDKRDVPDKVTLVEEKKVVKGGDEGEDIDIDDI